MDYFTVINLLPSVYHIEDPRGVYATLLIGAKQALLIDTAMGIGNLKKELEELTNLPLTVVNTHGHPDHTLGNYLFPEIYLAPEDWQLAKAENTVSVKQHVLSLSNICPADFNRKLYYDYQYDNLIPLEPGTVFDLGGITVKAIPMPSHSQGSVGFLCEEMQLLLSGDSIAPLVCLVFPESTDIDKHVAMLEYVQGLQFKWILSSHAARLIPKDEMKLYIECAKSIDIHKSLNFKSSLFPDYEGKIFSYENPANKGEFVFIAYVDIKIKRKDKRNRR